MVSPDLMIAFVVIALLVGLLLGRVLSDWQWTQAATMGVRKLVRGRWYHVFDEDHAGQRMRMTSLLKVQDRRKS